LLSTDYAFLDKMKNVQRVTIKDVARAAGVSVQTVSRVVNDRPDVAAETRMRVQEIISHLDYRPSDLARSLIQQRSYTLGVVTAGLRYIGPSRTLNGITQQANEMGYSLLLKELPGFISGEIPRLLQSLLARHVDGIVWAISEVGDNQYWLEEKLPDIPVPIIFLTTRGRPGIFSVSYDNELGGRMATQHLIDQGYRRIGHITGPLDWWEARQRKAGWIAALQGAGLRVSEDCVAEGNWSSASGEQAFRQLRAAYPEMDAVFVGNDQMALSMLQSACREGIRIPQDLGVVGFDGLPEARYYWPPLSTIFQDQNRLGAVAVEKVVEIIDRVRDEETFAPETIVLQPELVIRDSSMRYL
jgi:DNA-binding LacI/PurR family transcriptional regulator